MFKLGLPVVVFTQDSRAGKTPVTDALRGAVKLPPDFDEPAALTEELQKKHGGQG